MDENQSVTYLIDKYLRGDLSEDEKKAFFQLFEKDDLAAEVEEYLWQNYRQYAETTVWPDEFRYRFAARMSDRIVQSSQPARVVPFTQRRWVRYAAAAILVVIGTGTFFNYYLHTKQPSINLTTAQAKVVPGSNGAVLTLADGRQVVLDSLHSGVVAAQQGTNVVLNNGHLEYHAADDKVQVSYNMLEIPRGRQFEMTLPDGSKVWLNAASSIKYPTAFTGKERAVDITGEVFFEIAKDKARPFKVNVNTKYTIDVLGTSFNVNAYEQENAVNTTLVEGALRMNANNSSQILKPEQQAQVYDSAPVKVVNNVNISQVIAWKNGYFDFNDVALPVMMRQLERWYDIQVAYDGKMPDVIFKGKMDRNVQLSDVVSFLKNFGINANMHGRKLLISGS